MEALKTNQNSMLWIAQLINNAPYGKKMAIMNNLSKITGISVQNLKKIESMFKKAKEHPEIEELIKNINSTLPISKAYRDAISLIKQKQISFLKEKEELTDEEILMINDISIQPYNVWHFNKCDERFGFNYPGRIPGQIVIHVLYFFTNQGDLVVDPMAGSGTTVDACNLMKRRVLAYDINPVRPDIIKRDLLSELFPEEVSEAELVFWDPPYYKKMDKFYSNLSISKLDKNDYLSFFDKAANDLIKKEFKGKLAFLCSDYDNNADDDSDSIFIWDYVNVFSKNGLVPIKHIHIPLSTQSVHPDIVLKFRKSKKLARLSRSLVIFKVKK